MTGRGQPAPPGGGAVPGCPRRRLPAGKVADPRPAPSWLRPRPRRRGSGDWTGSDRGPWPRAHQRDRLPIILDAPPRYYVFALFAGSHIPLNSQRAESGRTTSCPGSPCPERRDASSGAGPLARNAGSSFPAPLEDPDRFPGNEAGAGVYRLVIALDIMPRSVEKADLLPI